MLGNIVSQNAVVTNTKEVEITLGEQIPGMYTRVLSLKAYLYT